MLPFQVSFYCFFPYQLRSFSSHYYRTLRIPLCTGVSGGLLRIPLCTGVSGGLRWTCSSHLNRCSTSFSLIGATRLCHHFGFNPFLYDHKSNATYTFTQHLFVEHIVFCRSIFCTIQHSRPNGCPIKLAF
jgi:hypothetical protein